MKKLSAFAVLTALSAAAGAQSSATIFGVVDVNVGINKNGAAGTSRYVGDSGNESSRLGFRGTEDLGGGLRAGFWLEADLYPDTGNLAGVAFTRRSTVSLMSDAVGELRLGRDNIPNYLTRIDFDPFGQNGVGSQANLIVLNQPIEVGNQLAAYAGAVNGTPLGSGAPTYKRSSNAVGYLLPGNLGGLYGQVMMAPGEGTTGLGTYASGRLGYKTGNWNVAGAYGRTKLTSAGASALADLTAGLSYDFGVVKLMGLYQKYSYDHSGGNTSLKNGLIGVTAPLGNGTLKASYGRSTVSGLATGVSGLGDGHAHMFAVGYVYDLSKRTALYTSAARISNSAGTQFTVGGQGTGPSMLVNGQFLSGQTSTGYEVGIRHRF
ncbi:MAG: porin [Ramlibacter sp.]|nr:porin [Ramlibacter sp.]